MRDLEMTELWDRAKSEGKKKGRRYAATISHQKITRSKRSKEALQYSPVSAPIHLHTTVSAPNHYPTYLLSYYIIIQGVH